MRLLSIRVASYGDISRRKTNKYFFLLEKDRETHIFLRLCLGNKRTLFFFLPPPNWSPENSYRSTSSPRHLTTINRRDWSLTHASTETREARPQHHFVELMRSCCVTGTPRKTPSSLLYTRAHGHCRLAGVAVIDMGELALPFHPWRYAHHIKLAPQCVERFHITTWKWI